MEISVQRRQAIQKAVELYGTPTYLYFEDIITDQYNKLKKSLSSVPNEIFYAVKASSNISLLKLIKNLGAGFDIVSEGELRRVILAGGNPNNTVYAGVAKTDDEIRFAIENDIRFFNVESYDELVAIENIATQMSRKANISFRVNPNVKVDTHPYLATGLKSSKFGIQIETIPEIFEKIKNSPFLKLVALDCHIGSQISDIDPYLMAYTEVTKLAIHLNNLGANIKYLDFGGGQGVSFSGHYEPLNIEAFGKMVLDVTKDTGFNIIFEPGKYLVSESALLLSEVIYTKQNNDKNFVIVDAGMNDLIRPSLYGAYHNITILNRDFSLSNNVQYTADIVGPVCESGCFFAQDRKVNIPNKGDYVIIHDAGAYGFVMASNYNTRRLPAEVLVSSTGELKLIRRRENYENLWSTEIF